MKYKMSLKRYRLVKQGKIWPLTDVDIHIVTKGFKKTTIPEKYRTPDWLFNEEGFCQNLHRKLCENIALARLQSKEIIP